MSDHPEPPAELADPFGLCGSTIDEKYRVDSVVGVGGHGVVYRSMHIGFDEPVAIKCLKLPSELDDAKRERLLARLREEGKVLIRLSKLSHAIVQALDVGAVTTASGHWVPFLVLEWLEGQTLDQQLADRQRRGQGPYSLDAAIKLLAPAARALAIAHEQKVAHRDIKPSNLHLSEAGGEPTLKVLDFGIAKVLAAHRQFSAAAASTQPAASAFTPEYGAPEQFNKRRGASGPWTDVFALALVLVELVSGRRALDGEDATQLYISAADPGARPTLRHHGIESSDAVEQVLEKALAIDPSRRYPNADRFFNALCAAAEGRSDFDAEPSSRTSAPPEPIAESAPDEPRSPRTGSDHRHRVAETITTAVDAPEGVLSSKWMPVVALLAIAGAGTLYLQLRQINSNEPVVSQHATPTTSRPAIAGVPAAFSAQRDASISPGLGPDGGAGGSGGAPSKTGSGGAGGNPEPSGSGGSKTTAAFDDMIRIVGTPGDGGLSSFFIDRTEVTTAAYQQCVRAGRCVPADRVVLTSSSVAALGASRSDAGVTPPEKLAQAWVKRCNARRNAADHPINCVSFASARDYCQFKARRLPTAAEWRQAAAGATQQRFVWGDTQPECSFACYGLNGSCLGRFKEVASCAVAVHPRDVSSAGVHDLGSNLAEWVNEQAGADPTPHAPPLRWVLGGNFIDEAAQLTTATQRALPPVTAHVTIGFRCARDAPAEPAGE